MKTLTYPLFHRFPLKGIILDIVAIAFIYLVPTLSHLLSWPLYLIEPMRLMLILAIVHTNKANGYFLALTLPLFSFVISAHPVLPKMLLISMELILNVFLYYFLLRKIKQVFPAIFLSIIISKTIYYLVKFILIRMIILDSDLFSTPLLIQLVTSVVFSVYLFICFKRQKEILPY